MPKIEIRYDPDNGLVFPDNKVESFVNNFNILGRDIYVCVGSALIIDYFRLAVKKGKISCNDIVFLFNDEVLPINKDGRLPRWPIGFCDHLMDVLSELK